MRILGIDPGTVHMGYGVLDGEGDDVTLVEGGVLNAPAKHPIEKRLLSLYQQLQDLVERVRPEVMSVEEAFVYRGPRKSGLAVGEARAIALVVAAGHDVPVFQYPPRTVKQAISGHGGGSKEQVRQMLGL
ncbi:crossover junction endodeoxyribonuclease RuvC, partial [Dehalococcoidia bacterium]|nr:crossover junction endodeoxyribonuclease RuvC [Dehalococcoidia bacterium]